MAQARLSAGHADCRRAPRARLRAKEFSLAARPGPRRHRRRGRRRKFAAGERAGGRRAAARDRLERGLRPRRRAFSGWPVTCSNESCRAGCARCRCSTCAAADARLSAAPAGLRSRALPLAAATTTVVLPLSYALTEPEANTNWVFGLGSRPQRTLPPLLYLALEMLVLPLFVFLPMHLLLARLFRRRLGWKRTSD